MDEIAYRDTWNKGISSYLSMLYERLILMHQLLSDDGSIFVHCDWKVNSFLRLIMDEIWDRKNFKNEIYWYYPNKIPDTRKKRFTNSTDCILFYTKSEKHIFHPQDEPRESPIKVSKMKKVNGKKIYEKDESGKGIYLERTTRVVDNVWKIAMLHAQPEILDYPTQKPESLLERIILTSTNEGDLVADFFCGSGTTIAVAEKLNRKWIACDLGRFSFHTTRKRMIEVQRHLQNEGKPFRSFEIFDLNTSERTNLFENKNTLSIDLSESLYIQGILKAYHAEGVKNFRRIQGKKNDRYVSIGSLDKSIPHVFLKDLVKECQIHQIFSVDVLGFNFENNLYPLIQSVISETNISIHPKFVPFRLINELDEINQKSLSAKTYYRFYDVPYFEFQAIMKDRLVKIVLSNFTSSYTQKDLDETAAMLKKETAKIVIQNGKFVKISKNTEGIVHREVLSKHWSEWVNYWAIDFQYQSENPIHPTFFENSWQSFKTKRNPVIEFESPFYSYHKPGSYQICIKVIDLLGLETTQTITIKI